MTTKRKIVAIVCFAVWLGMVNASRGSGIHNLKPFEILFMVWFASAMTQGVSWHWILYPLPLIGLFVIGTGELMTLLVTPILNWRFWEMLLPAAYTIIYWIPLLIRRKI